MTAPEPAADGGATRVDPERVRAFIAVGTAVVAELSARRRAVEGLWDEVAAACGPRSPGGDGLERLASVLRRLGRHDEALIGLLGRLAQADQPAPLVAAAPVARSPTASWGRWGPWLDPDTRSWAVNLTRLVVLGLPPGPAVLGRVGGDGPGVLADAARAAWELGPVNQLRLLVGQPERLARNWGRAGRSALQALGGLVGLAAGEAAVVSPGFDELAERLTGRRPGRELMLQVVQAAHLLAVDPDALAEAQLGWPELRTDPYRWLGRQAPNLLAELGLAEEALAVLRPLGRTGPRRAVSLERLGEVAVADEAGLPAVAGGEALLGREVAAGPGPVRPLPDLAEQRLGEPEWGPVGPLVSHRKGPWEPPETWVADVNRPGRLMPGRDVNCIDCARAVEANWRGHDAVAAPIADDWRFEGTSRLRLEQWSGGMLIDASIDQIGGMLGELGPGSSAMVVVDWEGGSAHAFNAVNDRGVITWIDGQSGRTGPWPPDYGIRIRASEAVFIEPDGRPVLPVDHHDLVGPGWPEGGTP